MKFLGKAEVIFTILVIGGVVIFTSVNFSKRKTNNKAPAIKETIIDTSWYDQLRYDLDHLLVKKNRFGFNGCLLVGWKDKVIYDGYIGYEDYAGRDSLTSNTRFQTASITKQFTAVAILQLYAQGRLSLTDSISKFFPGLPYDGFTIHQLLVHRSGLSNYVYFIDKLVEDKNVVITNDSVIRFWKEHEPRPYYPPGRRFDYSNSNYLLLASIVEKVSGMHYADYLQKYIFTPMGMNNSFVYYYGQHDTLPRVAEGYKYHWRVVTEAYLNGTYGDKGIYTTARDLFRWDQGLYNGEVIPYDTLKLAFRPMGKPKHFKHNYGYGWRMYRYKGEKILYHAGWWQGFKSLLIRVPRFKLSIIVLKNIRTGTMFGRKELLRVVLDRYLSAPASALVPGLPQYNYCTIPDDMG